MPEKTKTITLKLEEYSDLLAIKERIAALKRLIDTREVTFFRTSEVQAVLCIKESDNG